MFVLPTRHFSSVDPVSGLKYLFSRKVRSAWRSRWHGMEAREVILEKVFLGASAALGLLFASIAGLLLAAYAAKSVRAWKTPRSTSPVADIHGEAPLAGAEQGLRR